MTKPEITGSRIPGDRSSKENPPLLPLIVGMKEASHLLSCGHDQLYRFIRSGELEPQDHHAVDPGAYHQASSRHGWRVSAL